eukprot:CAMPEP_0168556466 /NCGR_PEP_ID=MMETSP0413-20121227/8894_1 /TAXON_ID=136452 /ORGANISM="Filamoeba nolandi, Strain NC-AS-23-1" /LENGTH=337 /DNA_ID=CAMNT_0008587407 /DNA_START=58 /DNA_END=1071 /DNA_ORIENTATION=-
MKAIAQTEGGASSVLKLIEVPKPVPGPRDVLVKNRAVATNPVDYKVRRGFTPSETQQHRIVGWDASGVVEAVGSEVQHYKVGDEVYYAGSILRAGSNAEYTVVDERIVGRKPNNLSWEHAAAIPLTGLTAWEALTEQMKITEPATNATNEHKVLLISGGAGGVGSIAIQLAKKIFKLKVIATASRPETVDFCKKMGADHTVDYKGDVEAQIKAFGFQGVDYILECFSLDTYFDTWLKVLNPFGVICSIVEAKGPLPVGNLMRRRGTLTWELMFTRPIFGIELEKQRHVLNHLADLCESKVIDPRVTVHYDSMHKLKEAHDLQESGKSIGKIAVTVSF